MKRITRLLALAVVVGALTAPALALGSANSTLPAMAGQGDQDPKEAVYGRFYNAYQKARDISKSDQNLTSPGNKDAYDKNMKEAYDAAKEYLEKFANADAQRDAFLKKFINDYDGGQKAAQRAQIEQSIKDKKYNEAFALGKQVLAANPDDLAVLYSLAWANLFNQSSGNTTNNADAISYAKKAIQLLEAGKSFEEAKPLAPKDRDETLARLNYALGFYTIKNSPDEAEAALVKAAHYDSTIKKDPQAYALLAVAYQASPYDKLRQDFAARCKTDGTTPECKAMTENINQVVDRIVDAYARAVAASGNDAKFQQKKTDWMAQLTSFYKYRHGDSDKGLPEYIAGILSKPVPDIPTMVAVPAPSTTGTATPGASGESSSGTSPTSTSTPGSGNAAPGQATQTTGATQGKPKTPPGTRP
jgi:tetratricopeptide (TPR) repeat protein